MRILFTLVLFYVIGIAECTYNNINKFTEKSGDSILLLGQYGKNNHNPCELQEVIKSKYIESFKYSNSSKFIILTMISGKEYTLTTSAIDIIDLINIFKNN